MSDLNESAEQINDSLPPPTEEELKALEQANINPDDLQNTLKELYTYNFNLGYTIGLSQIFKLLDQYLPIVDDFKKSLLKGREDIIRIVGQTDPEVLKQLIAEGHVPDLPEFNKETQEENKENETEQES